jgi:hypothetical protein
MFNLGSTRCEDLGLFGFPSRTVVYLPPPSLYIDSATVRLSTFSLPSLGCPLEPAPASCSPGRGEYACIAEDSDRCDANFFSIVCQAASMQSTALCIAEDGGRCDANFVEMYARLQVCSPLFWCNERGWKAPPCWTCVVAERSCPLHVLRSDTGCVSRFTLGETGVSCLCGAPTLPPKATF